MGTAMQVGNRWIPSFVFMLKRRVDWMEWNCYMRLPLVGYLHRCMEWWYEMVEDNHSNGVLIYVGKHYVVQPVLSGEHWHAIRICMCVEA